jgi:hypothetical protein
LRLGEGRAGFHKDQYDTDHPLYQVYYYLKKGPWSSGGRAG